MCTYPAIRYLVLSCHNTLYCCIPCCTRPVIFDTYSHVITALEFDQNEGMVLHITSFDMNAFYRHPHCQWERIQLLAPSRHYFRRCNSLTSLFKLYCSVCMESYIAIPDYHTRLEHLTNSNIYIMKSIFIDRFTGQQTRHLRCTSVAEGWYCLNSPSNRSEQKNSPKKVQGNFWVTCKARQEGHVTIWEEWVWGGPSKRDLLYLGLWWNSKREANSTNRSQRYQLQHDFNFNMPSLASFMSPLIHAFFLPSSLLLHEPSCLSPPTPYELPPTSLCET